MRTIAKLFVVFLCIIPGQVFGQGMDDNRLMEAIENTCMQIQSLNEYSVTVVRNRDGKIETKELSMDGDFVVEKDFDSAGNLKSVGMRNEEYLAAVARTSKESWAIRSYLDRNKPAFETSFSQVRHPALSRLYFAGKRIDDLTKSGTAELTSIKELQTGKILSFTISSKDTNSTSGLKTIQVDVDPETNCVLRVVRTFTDAVDTSEASDFVKVGESLVPTKITSLYQAEREKFQGSDQLEFSLSPKFDKEQCYLSFYGLSDSVKIAEPPKSFIVVYYILFFAAIVVAGSVYYFRKERSK